MITDQEVIRLFRHCASSDWGLKEQAPQDHMWHLVYRAPRRDFDTVLAWNEDWISFQASLSRKPLVPVREDRKAALYEYLLRLNEEIYLARFGLDRDGRILLLVDLTTQDLGLVEFGRALAAITTYTRRYHLEIQTVLEDRVVAQYVTSGKWTGPQARPELLVLDDHT